MIRYTNFAFTSEGELYDGEALASPSSSTLHAVKRLDRVLTEDFGAGGLHRILGVEDCAKVYLTAVKDETTFVFVVVHPAFQYFKVSLKTGTQFVVHIHKIIKAASAPRGSFRSVVAAMLEFMFGANSAKFARVELIAARKGDKYSGYFYWPEIGFEAESSEDLGDAFPERFQEFSAQDFRRWRAAGRTVHMYCDATLYASHTVQRLA